MRRTDTTINLELQNILTRHRNFQNYFGIIQDSRETLLNILEAVKKEGRDGVLLAEFMRVTIIQEIVHHCGHNDTRETIECIKDIHQDYFWSDASPLGEHLAIGAHREERVDDHQCESCMTRGCQISYHIFSLPPIVFLGVVRQAEEVPDELSIPLYFV
jgi:hypothetical protein